MAMKLVFLHGPVACGKLTVASELADRTGWRLFHNHLTVDLVTALFDFGSPPFARLREAIWLEAFAEAARAGESLIFTFAPEGTVDGSFPTRAADLVRSLGGEVVFIELACPEEEIERRIQNASRARFGKLCSLPEYRRLREAGAFDFPQLPAPLLRLDTSAMAPDDAAARIAAVLAAG